MNFEFKYENYQAVRRNLFWYSLVPLTIAIITFIYVLLPALWRQQFFAIASRVAEDFRPLVSVVTVTVLLSIVAFFVIEILEAHDKIYDRYVTRWRRGYDRHVILPRLLSPFLNRLGPAFFAKVDIDWSTAMKDLYFHYVGDEKEKISKNSRTRFYEKVTKYWMIIVNEMLLVILIGASLILAWIGPTTAEYRWTILRALTILLGLLPLNRLLSRIALPGVRKATMDQIEEIHENHLEDLKKRLESYCRTYGIPIV